MNGKMGSIEINIPAATKPKLPDTENKWGISEFSFKACLQSVWTFYKQDRGRVIFPLKVGLAVLLVSLLTLFEAPYQVLGTNCIWAILTAILVFEYTVGATFNRGFNRALGSLLAGILAIAVTQIALACGEVVEPIIIGLSIFLIAAITSFLKLWPSLMQYEYGFRVVMLTYCLIIVSGYRMGNPIKTSMDRVYSIAIGGIISVLVNVFVFPMWAGEQLHKELAKSFDSVADSLEECVKKYLEDEGSEQSGFNKNVMDEFPDEPAYKRCQSTLNSEPKLDSLTNSAKWEPPHGRFMHFFYPWSQYPKVGAVLRYCAFEVMALHSILHSEIQAAYNLRIAFGSEIREVSSQAAELVRTLGRDISNMERRMRTSQIKRVHTSTERLQRSIELHSYLLTTNFESPGKPLSKLTHAMSYTLYTLPHQLAEAEIEGKIPEKNSKPLPSQTDCSYHEIIARKQCRRTYSWPSREVDAFEEDGGSGATTDLLPRMKALESTAALSLTNFTSSLIEFVARLDYLVEAVDKLSDMAKFTNEGL